VPVDAVGDAQLLSDSTIRKVTPQGVVRTIAQGLPVWYGPIALDASGTFHIALSTTICKVDTQRTAVPCARLGTSDFITALATDASGPESARCPVPAVRERRFQGLRSIWLAHLARDDVANPGCSELRLSASRRPVASTCRSSHRRCCRHDLEASLLTPKFDCSRQTVHRLGLQPSTPDRSET
jgi:hypothetical protein